MTQPAPPVTPAQRLDDAEQQAAQEIDRILAGIAAAGITGAALLAAAAAIIAAILGPAQAAMAVGASIALDGAGRRRGTGRLQEQPIPTPIDTDVLALLEDAAARIEAAEERAAELERTRRQLHRLAVTKIHQAASSGTAMYARWLGVGLRWVTRLDGRACVACAAMHGRRVEPGEVFAAPTGPGIPTVWPGFRGLPPIHPNCRCRVHPA
ncbi:phage minor head protein [Nocardiopsis composta]|uniref:Phage head morphogenesis domain-containing protein n=1 Tax=Nocardiopsis composta TaxID=157465 RepID=A0A7W8VCE9_9ACTN|nr:phage minor head protein [Nocardiopsis composta]MBB5431366.1 hypothetical protein [Nocardiopsis composta]